MTTIDIVVVIATLLAFTSLFLWFTLSGRRRHNERPLQLRALLEDTSISSNEKLLATYYTDGLEDARRLSMASLGFAGLGFLVVVWSVISLLQADTRRIEVPRSTILAGQRGLQNEREKLQAQLVSEKEKRATAASEARKRHAEMAPYRVQAKAIGARLEGIEKIIAQRISGTSGPVPYRERPEDVLAESYGQRTYLYSYARSSKEDPITLDKLSSDVQKIGVVVATRAEGGRRLIKDLAQASEPIRQGIPATTAAAETSEAPHRPSPEPAVKDPLIERLESCIQELGNASSSNDASLLSARYPAANTPPADLEHIATEVKARMSAAFASLDDAIAAGSKALYERWLRRKDELEQVVSLQDEIYGNEVVQPSSEIDSALHENELASTNLRKELAELSEKTKPGDGLSAFLPGIVSAITGAITQAVAALFFVQANRSKDSLSSSFDRLRQDTRAQQAPILAHEISQGNLRDRVTAAIALGFAQSTLSVVDVDHSDGKTTSGPSPASADSTRKPNEAPASG